MSNFVNNSVKLFKIARLALKYKGTSFKILTDFGKKKFLNQRVPSFPKVITLYITNRCNLHCPMCLNVNYRDKNILDTGINIKTIQKILPELIKYKPLVCISGGEPLLNPDIFKVISLLAKNKIITSMTTNGFFLEKYARQIIDSGLEFLSISLDHFDENQHDQGRGVKTTYRRLIEGLSTVVKARVKTPTNIKINTVIRKDNYTDLSQMYDFIESLGVDEWSIQHYSFINPPAQKLINKYKKTNYQGDYIVGNFIQQNAFFNTKQIQILQNQLKQIKRKNSRYKTRLSIKPEVSDIFSYYQGIFPSKKSQCNWPFESINMMDGAKVSLCIGNEIGDIENEISIKRIWHSEKAHDFQELIRKEKILPLCFRCCGLKFYF